MKKIMPFILSGVLSTLACTPVTASVNEGIEMYVEKIPGIGLISDSIEFDGITLSHFRFDNDKKYIFVKPEEEFSAHMNYEIDASLLKTLHLHHLVIGLYDDGPQQCILHSLGVLDSHGAITTTLKAPKKKGAYQVRFCHSVGLTDTEAQKAWWRGDGPSAKTIMGIVIVK
jgi:hypothetical protein